jgi:lipoprotein-releasing system permease protein
MNRSVNTEIAFTHLLSRKRQTLVASLGVTVGIAMYVFMNSLTLGVNRYSDSAIFKSAPHLRVFKEDEISKPLSTNSGKDRTPVIINPKISNTSLNLLNPVKLLADLQSQPGIVYVAPLVTTNLFYTNGKSQVNGIASGVNILEANAMFNIESTMIDGDLRSLVTTANGILLGVGIVNRLNVKLNDNINVVSATGVVKLMKVVGIFKTSFAFTDKSKSYVNLATAQQLLGQGPNYVTDIYINVKDPKTAPEYVARLKNLTGYSVEDWQTANEQAVAGSKIRGIMLGGISWAILLVAAFGIYNILNMTITSKLNDIAILKATGFSGKDVVRIFVLEALVMGFIGTCLGVLLSYVPVYILGHVYIGADIGYFPIQFEPSIAIRGGWIGMLVTFCAGYIPAQRAARVDPLAIFRR